MPKNVRPRARRRPIKRRVKRRPRGGRVKPSDILGGISGASAGASALFPVVAPIGIPLSGATGIASGISRLFGFGGLTKQQAEVLLRAQKQGLVIGKRKPPVRRRKTKVSIRRRRR